MGYKDKQKASNLAAERTRQRRLTNREVTDAVKREAGCRFCGEREPICLDFHHLDPSQKGFTIAGHLGRSLANVLAEVAKCVVVCANCHRKLHAGLLTLGDGDEAEGTED